MTDSLSGKEIYELFTTGDHGPLADSADSIRYIAERYEQQYGGIASVLANLPALWQGRGSDLAQKVIRALGDECRDAVSNFAVVRQRVQDQADSFARAKASVVVVPSEPQPLLRNASPVDVQTYQQQVRAYNEANQHNVHVMSQYEAETMANADMPTRWGTTVGDPAPEPPWLVKTPPTTPSGGSRVSSGQGYQQPVFSPKPVPGHAPAAPPAPPPSNPAPVFNAPGRPPAHGVTQPTGPPQEVTSISHSEVGTTNNQTVSAQAFDARTPSTAGTAAGVGPGSPGGVPGRGNSDGRMSNRGNAGPGGSGGGSTARTPGRGGQAGMSGNKAMGNNGMGGPAGRGRGKNEEDQEHIRRPYLKEYDPDGVFGDDRLTAPAVIE